MKKTKTIKIQKLTVTMNTQMNKFQNIYKSKNKENSKISTNKQIGSSAYSKNKKTLEKMLREYQTFCKKYFGESTPIGSMTEIRKKN